MTPDADNSILGWLFGAGGGLATLAAAWKYIHDRKREGTVEQQNDSAFAKINGIADELREQVRELNARCDTFAQERNGYLVQVAELKSEVKHLEQDLAQARERIATLEGERNAARDLLAQLQTMFDKFRAESEAIKTENDGMRRQLARLRRGDHTWGEGYSHEA
jgi:chromosome segregation ATPase